MSCAREPLNLTMASAPRPLGVAVATMVSSAPGKTPDAAPVMTSRAAQLRRVHRPRRGGRVDRRRGLRHGVVGAP